MHLSHLCRFEMTKKQWVKKETLDEMEPEMHSKLARNKETNKETKKQTSNNKTNQKTSNRCINHTPYTSSLVSCSLHQQHNTAN